ncbi:MAG: translation initiation factor IF-3 [Thermoleophilaceae bacterium]|nr:translation initiation factor IF-3 [Thermoleophilaceae bacterium]
MPRRFDRTPPERDSTRVNERIRVPEVRVIGEDGEQIGVLKRDDALKLAQERDLDLVEIAAEAKPPVCKILDYSKWKYQQEQKAKEARKHQQQVTIREMKMRPKIAVHDYETKKGHVERFLKQGAKVKITIMFRGREMTHPERGENLLMRLAEDVAEIGVVESRPNQDGRNMTMLLGPTRVEPKPKQEAPAKPKQEAPAKPKQKAPAEAAEPKQEPPAEPKQEAPAKPKQEAPAKPKQEAPAEPKQEVPAEPQHPQSA